MTDKKSKLADNKTKPTGGSVEDFLHTVSPAQRRDDSLALLEIMRKASGEEPLLWSNSFVGFGMVIHKSPTSGRQSEWMRIGFAPRKSNLSLYFGTYVAAHTASLEKLGKYKAGMGCVYINKLADIDLDVLKTMIEDGLRRQ